MAANRKLSRHQSRLKASVVGGVAVATLIGALVIVASRDDSDRLSPVDSSPATLKASTTMAPTPTAVVPVNSSPASLSANTGPAPPTSPLLPVHAYSSEALVNEPTLDYRDGVEWWVPGGLPDGWRYGYAFDDGEVQTIRLLADDRSTIDVEFGADGATIGELAVNAASQDLGGESWEVAAEDGVGVAARVVGGRLVAVRGPIDPVRSVAAALELVPETELVRAPFRADAEPGRVVLTLSADEVGGQQPFELRAHTDGLFTTVGGEIKQVSSDDPLAFGDYVYVLTGDATSYPVIVTGVALNGVAQTTFGLLAGDALEVTTTHSDRFTESFYAFVIDVPAPVLEQYENGGLERLTRWTFTFVDGIQRVYDEPASQNCVNCDVLTVGPGEVDASAVSPGGASEGTSPLVFEPTNVPGDELWMVPAEVPDGFEFAYAMRNTFGDEVVQQVIYHDGDPELGESMRVVTYLRPNGGAVTAPPISRATAVEIGGETWSWDSGILSGVVDGHAVEVWANRGTAVAVADTLERVPESQLQRPPFSDNPSSSVVVATLSGLTTTASSPTELRAATDGVWISLNGGTPTGLSSDDPVAFGGGFSGTPASGAETGVFVISGITMPDVATLQFEQLDGEVVTVVPEDLSGHFGIGFFFVAVQVPGGGLDPYETYASVVPSVIARDTGGRVLAAISEPF